MFMPKAKSEVARKVKVLPEKSDFSKTSRAKLPSKTILELNADITQLSSLSSPQITNAQIGSFLKPQFSIFDNNPSGSYALTASLNSTNYTPIYKEFLHVGVGRNSFVLGDGKLSGIWSANISLYRFNQTQSRWENVYSVSGVVNFG